MRKKEESLQLRTYTRLTLQRKLAMTLTFKGTLQTTYNL